MAKNVLDVNWSYIFNQFVLSKNKFKLNGLQSLSVNGISNNDAIGLIQTLNIIKDDKYINLQELIINVASVLNDGSPGLNDRLNKFINNLILLLNGYNNSFNNLHNLRISFENTLQRCTQNAYSLQNNWKCMSYLDSHYSFQSTKYYKSILNLLSALPKSVREFTFKVPPISSFPDKDKWQQDSINIVKELCKIKAEKNDSDLQQIQLHDLKLSSKAKEFLIFFFGYQRKLFNSKNTYYLTFI